MIPERKPSRPFWAKSIRTPRSQTRIVIVLAEPDAEQAQTTLTEAIKSVPERSQLAIAEALAGDAAGAMALIELIDKACMGQRVLARPSVKQKLQASARGELAGRIRELVAHLPPENQVLAALIDQRRGGYAKASASAEKGAAVFAKHCAACHQIAGKGAVVGPQLDGIGNRGLDRLLEDMHRPQPQRRCGVSHDHAADGRRPRRDRACSAARTARTRLADDKGKEFTVNKDRRAGAKEDARLAHAGQRGRDRPAARLFRFDGLFACPAR